jgi:hypothetical protein
VKEVEMNEQDFKDLVSSIEQAGKIRRRELAPARVTELPSAEIRVIRARTAHTAPD